MSGTIWTPNLWLFEGLARAADDGALKTSALDDSADPRLGTSPVLPTLDEVDAWYEDVVRPARTIGPGNSWHTIDDVARGFFSGNKAEPNGICGDTCLYVQQQFREFVPGGVTADGYSMLTVVWFEADELDAYNSVTDQTHAAVVMAKPITRNLSFGYDSKAMTVSGHASNPAQPKWDDVRSWHVYDLFKLWSAKSVEQWWLNLRGRLHSTEVSSILIGDL